MIEKILCGALQLIHAGENERPVPALNFRSKAKGGLGLIHPWVKSRAYTLYPIFCILKASHSLFSIAEFGHRNCQNINWSQ